MLTLQGVGWFTRKAIQLATVTLDINQYRDDNGVEHIDIEQTATGGIKGTTENRTLDWTYVFFSLLPTLERRANDGCCCCSERQHEDHLFGKLVAKSRRLKLADVEDEFLRSGFLAEVDTDGAVESFAANNDIGWSVQQVCVPPPLPLGVIFILFYIWRADGGRGVCVQIWGFEEIAELRYYVRHLKFKKFAANPEGEEKVIDRKLVYDYAAGQ